MQADQTQLCALDLEDTISGRLNLVAAALRVMSGAQNYDPRDMAGTLGHLAEQLEVASVALRELRGARPD